MLRDDSRAPAHGPRRVSTAEAARSARSKAAARGPCSAFKPRNREQAFALDLLLDDYGASLVTLIGKAGTGKTLLALAAGLKRDGR